MREKARGRAQFRLVILCASFVIAFTAIGARMGLMAATEPVEPRASAPGAEIIAQRADITDRNGRILGDQHDDPCALCASQGHGGPQGRGFEAGRDLPRA
jgi:cell division protein FtsI/penicillin-binding protein 2